MSKSLGRYPNPDERKSRKGPVQKACEDNNTCLEYDVNYRLVMDRKDKGVLNFQGTVSRDQQSRGIYDELPPQCPQFQSHEVVDMLKAYKRLGHTKK